MKIIMFPLIITVFLMSYSLYITAKDYKYFNQIKKLINQESKHYKNKKIFNICLIFFICILLMSLAFVVLTIICLIIMSNTLILIQSVVCIIYMLMLILWITLIQNKIKSIYVVVKNNKMVIWNKVFEFEEIEVIKNDVNRKKIIFKVKEAEGYDFIKVSYHWELKDFLTELKIKTEFI
ncbi:hypothetical protein CG007_01880 [Mesoplasma entomophilum]|uniref:hypothetical protein n=1 Tax=Mesoplasma entomophilum TaxID=2149 RepID=UPI000D025C0A|nr:hypothetical protein [Mesoplasma entomophilum]AVN60366.1 hypothetical protein CG007_01880 [Mesoplasma entomophilum]